MAGGGHRPTLKQTNKRHNHGRHRSKRNRKREAHGKVNVKTMTKNKQVKALLRKETLEKRSGDRQDTFDQGRHIAAPPPRLVVIVSLDKSVSSTAVLELLKEADLSSECKASEQNLHHVSACKFKNRMSFLAPEYGDLQAALDASKVADVLLFLVSAEKGMDDYGQHCLTCIVAQGVPSHAFACQGISALSKKKASDARKVIEKQIDRRFPGEKARPIDNWQDSQALWRQLANIAQQPVHFRDSRPYLIAEKVEYEPSSATETGDADEGQSFGTVKVTGYVRGQELNVNQLIHIPGWGDFQMSQIDENDDPYPLIVKGNKDRRGMTKDKGDAEMDDVSHSSVCLAIATNPESLQSEIIPNEMDQEQTWPTPAELGEEKEHKVKTLKGVSDYQRNWLLGLEEDDDESDSDDEDEAMEDSKSVDSKEDEEEEEEDDGLDTMTEVPEEGEYDKMMDLDEEKKMYERMKEERLHVHFPDEIDTPIDVDARTRFARYRGMDSFQTTVWDYNESLPYDYARIYRVSKHHYKRLRKISSKPREEDDDEALPAEPGVFVTVHVKNVSKSFMDMHSSNAVLTLYGLFKNEQKMTLVSTLITREQGFKSPVKSKDPLVFQIGFRRFSACPIFSEHSYQNKFKMERFLPSSGFIVASMYAPIIFAPAPVIVFRENVMEKLDLVAKGSLMPLDTNRIVIKRVVLSGAPFKINKRSVVVRYMFFNREDIDFYKPIELKTKYGKRGHIKQALGTHGHMKCTFNGTLRSEDTVLMYLYKRMFPKWSYNPIVSILPPHSDQKTEFEQEMDEAEDEEKGNAYEMFD